jgi:hypothetical protein
LLHSGTVSRRSAKQRTRSTQPLQHPTQLLLKNDRDSHKQSRKHLLRQPSESPQAYQATQRTHDNQEYNHTTEQRHCTGAPHQVQDPEESESNQQDVESIYPVESL